MRGKLILEEDLGGEGKGRRNILFLHCISGTIALLFFFFLFTLGGYWMRYMSCDALCLFCGARLPLCQRLLYSWLGLYLVADLKLGGRRFVSMSD